MLKKSFEVKEFSVSYFKHYPCLQLLKESYTELNISPTKSKIHVTWNKDQIIISLETLLFLNNII